MKFTHAITTTMPGVSVLSKTNMCVNMMFEYFGIVKSKNSVDITIVTVFSQGFTLT